MYFLVVEGEDLFVLVVGVEDVCFFPVVWGFTMTVNTEMNIRQVFIVIGRVHYSP